MTITHSQVLKIWCKSVNYFLRNNALKSQKKKNIKKKNPKRPLETRDPNNNKKTFKHQ